MKTTVYIWLFFTSLMLWISSCKEIETFSEIPEVKYKGFVLSDKVLYDSSALAFPYVLGTLTFEFKDGDGDFGHSCQTTDTSYNMYITQLEKRDGQYYPKDIVDSLRQNYNRRICYDEAMSREGQNKLLQGEIEIYFKYLLNFSTFDTIMYEFYINDNSNHQSNVETSDEIVIDWDSYQK